VLKFFCLMKSEMWFWFCCVKSGAILSAALIFFSEPGQAYWKTTGIVTNEQEYTDFSKIWEPLQICRCCKGDTWLVLYGGPTNIRCNDTKFSFPGIFVPLLMNICWFKICFLWEGWSHFVVNTVWIVFTVASVLLFDAIVGNLCVIT
jgi:hypothetical protein